MLEKDPFQSIDTVGVGGLVKMACEKGRAVAKAQKKAFKRGVCGEHGGDPASIAFFQKCGLDSVSCSPCPSHGGVEGMSGGCFGSRLRRYGRE